MCESILIINLDGDWYTQDAFDDYLDDLDLDAKAQLINVTVDQCEERLHCEDCTGRFALNERVYWIDYLPHCPDCFGSIFSEMPLKSVVRRAELDYIEAIN